LNITAFILLDGNGIPGTPSLVLPTSICEVINEKPFNVTSFMNGISTTQHTDWNIVTFQMISITDSGKHEKLRRIDCSSALGSLTSTILLLQKAKV